MQLDSMFSRRPTCTIQTQPGDPEPGTPEFSGRHVVPALAILSNCWGYTLYEGDVTVLYEGGGRYTIRQSEYPEAA